MADERTIADIESDLTQARQRLVQNLSSLVTQVHPKAVTHRKIKAVRAQAHQSLVKIQSAFKDETGWKPVPIAIGVAATAIVLSVILATTKK